MDFHKVFINISESMGACWLSKSSGKAQKKGSIGLSRGPML